ncbi:hypothetical protein QE152_g13208 [Popillia japonica]|uniref:Zinc finger DNA binding protein n=1 Tax=Popillia japonica TaxID=7064 RepID=A0AAW1LG68_POPJA
MATEYNLRNKPNPTIIEEASATQKVLEKMLLSEEFLTKISSKISEFISLRLQQQVEDLKAEVKMLRTELSEVNKKNEMLEQHSRSYNLRIFGVKEQANEDVNEVVIDLCKRKLSVDVQLCDIDIAHRLKSKEGTTLPIIVSFVRRSLKKKIFNNKRKLKGSNIFVKEDLTTFRMSLLKELANYSPKGSWWTYNGKLFSKLGNNIHHINCIADIKNVCLVDLQWEVIQ